MFKFGDLGFGGFLLSGAVLLLLLEELVLLPDIGKCCLELSDFASIIGDLPVYLLQLA